MALEVPANPQIDLASIPALEALSFTGVSAQYRTMRLMVWGLVQLVLLLLIFSPFVALALFPEREEWAELQYTQWWIPLGIQALFCGFWLAEELLGFPRKGYAVRDRDITYRSGWFSRTTLVIPFGQIQHIELAQGPIARMFGVKHLKLFTAGGSGNLRIPGIEEQAAEVLRSVLDQRTGKG